MDVHCSTCGEPWDVYHLRHDAIYDALPPEEAEAWSALPRNQKLSEHYRGAFRAAGWEFGGSVINVKRCPACPKDAKPNLEKVMTKAAIEELLGGDEDGLAATFEDYRL
ncbi:MAG: hypothetical protein ABSC18_00480 [Verrucomicrobiota bacterium]|jgi:hypothetical protein